MVCSKDDRHLFPLLDENESQHKESKWTCTAKRIEYVVVVVEIMYQIPFVASVKGWSQITGWSVRDT